MHHSRRTLSLLLAVATVWAFGAPPAAAQSSAEELILTAGLATDLANQALSDVVLPVGGLLGRISPSSAFASDAHGFGYAALSLGAVGLQFQMTNPDYDYFKTNGVADVVEGPAAAVYADLELGVYRGTQWGRFSNVGAIDLLFRYGLTIGDQEDLSENDIDVNQVLETLEPIYGAGVRIGLLRGPGLPAVSFAAGFNHFVQRSFGFSGDVGGQPFGIKLDLEQTSSFYMLEVSKQMLFLTPYVGVGMVRHGMRSEYAADIRIDGSTASAVIGDKVHVNRTDANLFGGAEFFSNTPVRLALELGTLDDNFYGSLALRLVPIGRR